MCLEPPVATKKSTSMSIKIHKSDISTAIREPTEQRPVNRPVFRVNIIYFGLFRGIKTWKYQSETYQRVDDCIRSTSVVIQ